MKKTLNIVGLLTAVVMAKAQIPNAGFENWTTVGNYEDPDNWGTLNSATSILNQYTCTKGTPGHSGSSYVKLTAKNLGIQVAPGLIVTGAINVTTQSVSGGFPYAQRPTTLDGYFQHVATGTGGGIIVLLTAWNSGTNMRDTIGAGGLQLSGMAMSWTSFSGPITYFLSGNPDTAQIFMVTSVTNVTANDYLYVDDLAFGFNIGVPTISNPMNAEVYPNPSHTSTTITYQSSVPGSVVINIEAMNGQLISTRNVGVVAGLNKTELNLEGINKGIYFISIQQGESVSTKTLVIN